MEIIKKVETLELLAQDCLIVADTVTARLNVIHAQLMDIITDFWGAREKEAEDLGGNGDGQTRLD